MPQDPPAPLAVMDCTLMIMALGRSAQTLRELRDHVATAPLQSISHHFYETLLRLAFDDPEYRNDFALWTRRQLHDALLAERLGVIDPIDYDDLEQSWLHREDHANPTGPLPPESGQAVRPNG